MLALAVLVGVLPSAPAFALTVQTLESSRVLGEVTHERIRVTLDSGAVARGEVLRFREDDPNVSLEPRLARGTVAGLQQMLPMAEGELTRGAIAGINGGYSLPRPTGVPNGLHVTDGRMVAGQAVNSYAGGARPTGRGMVGIQSSGRMVMDEILVSLELDLPDTPAQPDIVEPVRFDELNRQVWPASVTRSNGEPWRPNGELLLYDEHFGASIATPAGSKIVVVRGLDVGTSGRTEGDVVAVYPSDPALDRTQEDSGLGVAQDRYVIVGYGDRAAELDGIEIGHRIGVTSAITPLRTPAEGWQDLNGGVAGGQMMVHAGERRPSTEWDSYAAFSTSHNTGRNPRTAIGRTADGEVLLVTIDGRRPGWSVGMSVAELADTMIALGAVDAVNLDGGDSTTMTIDARAVNRPSHDVYSTPRAPRSIADGLFLYTELPAINRSLVNACPPGEVPAPGFADSPGTTHADAIACLAWWGVTTGVTETQYAPLAGVTREQMASFIARWVDGVNARGDGTALPAAGATPFTDVAPTNVHADAIARLTDVGIIRGTSETTYTPRKVMTRAQTASLLRRAVDYVTGSPLPSGRDTFLDDNGSVHEANVDALASVGVITGTGGFTFNPAGNVTRGAMAALVMRSSDLVVEQGRTTPPA